MRSLPPYFLSFLHAQIQQGPQERDWHLQSRDQLVLHRLCWILQLFGMCDRETIHWEYGRAFSFQGLLVFIARLPSPLSLVSRVSAQRALDKVIGEENRPRKNHAPHPCPIIFQCSAQVSCRRLLLGSASRKQASEHHGA